MSSDVNTYPCQPATIRPMAFSEYLRKTQRERGMSGRDIAEAMQVSHTQVGRYLNKGAEPTLPAARRLAEALNVSVDEIAGLRPEDREAAQSVQLVKVARQARLMKAKMDALAAEMDALVADLADLAALGAGEEPADTGPS